MGTLAADLEFVKELVQEAAAVALARHALVQAQEKSNKSFVTDLDVDLERLIRQRIAQRYPDDVLTGEELASHDQRQKLWKGCSTSV